jgi:hypothetical protein
MRKWLVGSIGIFMIGTMLSCLMSGRWLLNGEINIFNALASFNVMSVAAAGGWGVAKTIGSYFNGIITALSWNYPFLDSAWCIFLKIPLWLVSIGTVWGFIELGITVIQSLASSVSSVIRSFTGG